MASLPQEGRQIKRCTVAICSCTVTIQTNDWQVKKLKRLTGKIYNKRQVDYSHLSMSQEDNNFDDDFDDEEFDEEGEDEFGDEEAGAKLYPIPRFPQTWVLVHQT